MRGRGQRGGDDDRGHYHLHCCKHLPAVWMGDGGEMRGRQDGGGGARKMMMRVGREDDATRPMKHPQPPPQAIARGVERGCYMSGTGARGGHDTPCVNISISMFFCFLVFLSLSLSLSLPLSLPLSLLSCSSPPSFSPCSPFYSHYLHHFVMYICSKYMSL